MAGTDIGFSPDGSIVSFLAPVAPGAGKELYGFSVESKTVGELFAAVDDGNVESKLSHEEKLRRERQRLFAEGVTSYSWFVCGGQSRVLVPQAGRLFVRTVATGDVVELPKPGAGPALDAVVSPDGKWVAYVWSNDVHVVRSDGSGSAVQLTFGAKPGVTCGMADYLAQEEMGRFQGFWWSPDSASIAFQETDENHIPLFRIQHYDAEGTYEEHRYPFAGHENPRVRVGVVRLPGGGSEWSAARYAAETVWLDPSLFNDTYMAELRWLNAGIVSTQIIPRDHSKVDLIVYNALTGASQCILSEKADCWFNINKLMKVLPSADTTTIQFTWGSERTGFQHLYLYQWSTDSATAEVLGTITTGPWVVDTLEGYDAEHKAVFITGSGTGVGATERHLYCAIMGPEPRCVPLTTVPGTHAAAINADCTLCGDSWTSLTAPAQCDIYSIEWNVNEEGQDTPSLTLIGAGSAPGATAPRPPVLQPKIVEFVAADGTTPLYGFKFYPDVERFGPGPYPTVLQVYGGPGVQVVANSHRIPSATVVCGLLDNGFLVVQVDNRGGIRRGKAFENPIYKRLGEVEVQDQAAVIRQLLAAGETIGPKVGIFGWSYGGYMSLLCAAKQPDLICAAVSGAPVSFWEGYDTFYTEKYMNTPQNNPEGYASSSIVDVSGTITTPLLMIHGLQDENVHFRHTARVIESLNARERNYEALLLPSSRHGVRTAADRRIVDKRTVQFFVRHMQ